VKRKKRRCDDRQKKKKKRISASVKKGKGRNGFACRPGGKPKQVVIPVDFVEGGRKGKHVRLARIEGRRKKSHLLLRCN